MVYVIEPHVNEEINLLLPIVDLRIEEIKGQERNKEQEYFLHQDCLNKNKECREEGTKGQNKKPIFHHKGTKVFAYSKIFLRFSKR